MVNRNSIIAIVLGLVLYFVLSMTVLFGGAFILAANGRLLMEMYESDLATSFMLVVTFLSCAAGGALISKFLGKRALIEAGIAGLIATVACLRASFDLPLWAAITVNLLTLPAFLAGGGGGLRCAVTLRSVCVLSEKYRTYLFWKI